MGGTLLVAVVIAVFAMFVVSRIARVVPQQQAWIVERLGRYNRTLQAGFHILWPFFDSVRYKHSLKESAVDVPEQVCITKDNVQVAVDGVLYFKVLNPERASYGISDYNYAIQQLAQTNLRSEIGKIELDKTFEERTHINGQVVSEVDKASEAWGVKVLRYEIKNITPPRDIIAAMEKQLVIKQSEAKKQQQINEAEGQASAILAVARATAEGIRSVAESINSAGGFEAVQLRVAEQYITEFGKLAKSANTLVVPSNLSDVGAMIGLAMSAIRPKAEPSLKGPLAPPR